jgi:hypothetical protein
MTLARDHAADALVAIGGRKLRADDARDAAHTLNSARAGAGPNQERKRASGVARRHASTAAA